MNYGVEMDLGAILFTPNSIKINLVINKLMGGGGVHGHTDNMQIS